MSDAPEPAPQTVQDVLTAHHAVLEELTLAVNALQAKIDELETRLAVRIVRPGAVRLN